MKGEIIFSKVDWVWFMEDFHFGLMTVPKLTSGKASALLWVDATGSGGWVEPEKIQRSRGARGDHRESPDEFRKDSDKGDVGTKTDVKCAS